MRDAAPIRALLLLVGLVSLVAMPYAVLMPVFAAKILHGNARTLGILMGVDGRGRAERRAGARVAPRSARDWRGSFRSPARRSAWR